MKKSSKILTTLILTLVLMSGCAGSQPNPDLVLGGLDLEEAVNGMISRIHQVMGTVNNLDSAKKADAELKLVSMNLDDLIFNSQKLNMEGQTALSMVMLNKVPDINTLINQVKTSPAIEEILGETLVGIRDKMNSLI
ncbi:MAG: hypothetical protein GY780_03160 [bacterium]|nr:hypothetical protein [bacterium]